MISYFDILGHVSNAIYAFGFYVKNMVWLRIWIIIGCLIEMVYRFYVAGRPLWTDIIWCVLFIVVNAYQLGVLYRERRCQTLTTEQRELHAKVFHMLTVPEFKKLLRIADWKEFAANAVLISKGMQLDSLLLIARGSAVVEVDGSVISYLRDGNFAGEISFLSGNLTSATVVTAKPTRCLLWKKEKLTALMEENDCLKVGLQQVFNNDLVAKLLMHTMSDSQPVV